MMCDICPFSKSEKAVKRWGQKGCDSIEECATELLGGSLVLGQPQIDPHRCFKSAEYRSPVDLGPCKPHEVPCRGHQQWLDQRISKIERTMFKTIYCCGCQKDVSAILTTGKTIYPHRPDLFRLPFWMCQECKNYVGCHHKTKKPTEPLGVIPTDAIRQARIRLHDVMDPLWKTRKVNRGQLYRLIAKASGKKFHAANTRSVEEVERLIQIINQIKQELH